MNVPMKTKTNVIQTPCVPTPKDHMFAAASEDMKATAEVAQVILCTFFRNKVFFFLLSHLRNRISILLAAVSLGCSPSCGPNAFCQEGLCVFNFGFVGDEYNCTGLCKNEYISYKEQS